MQKALPTKIISANLRGQMIIHIRDQIAFNLEALEKFLTTQGYEMLCTAIFSYAVEEFGKLLILQQSTKLTNGDFEIVYGKGVGFLSHNEKFRLADAKLPPDCVEVSSGGLTRKGYSSKSFTTPTPADWATRLLILHADFDDTFTSIKKAPRVDAGTLKTAVQNLKNYVKSYPVP